MVALDREPPGVGIAPSSTRRTGRSVLLVWMFALVVAFSSAPVASGQREPIPWRNADAASNRLDEARERLEAARDEQRRLERLLEELRQQSAAVDAATLELAEDLHDTRTRARRLAVEAYVNGTGLPEVIYLLDAPTANDFAYRSTLIGEGSEALVDSSGAYADLRADADADAVVLAERIDDIAGDLDAAADAIDEASAEVVDAEEVLRIARIHAEADEVFARTGRAEPTEQQWEDLRHCEATGDYAANTGNGFYGAYQFTVSTWRSVGGSGLASNASVHEQDARARVLFALEGAQPWPRCGRFLPGG